MDRKKSELAIPDLMRKVFGGTRERTEVSRAELKRRFGEKFPQVNLASVIPSDYCYNIINRGAVFNCHLFLRTKRGRYQVVGEGYLYEGDIRWKNEKVGEWRENPPKPIVFQSHAALFKL